MAEKKRMLLVSTDLDFCEFFQKLGDNKGYEVIRSFHTDAALLTDFIKEGNFDIVIQDLVIPNTERGIKLFLEIRAAKELFHLPMMLFSIQDSPAGTVRQITLRRNTGYTDFPTCLDKVAEKIEDSFKRNATVSSSSIR